MPRPCGGRRSGGGAGWRGVCAGLITHTVPNKGVELTASSRSSRLALAFSHQGNPLTKAEKPKSW